MEATTYNERMIVLLKSVPIAFAVCAALLAISLWRGPISIAYLLTCAMVGILGWGLILFGYARDRLNAALTLCTVLLPLGLPLRYLFFSVFDQTVSRWSILAQYGAVVYMVIFGLTLTFRSRIRSSLIKHDAEQFVGPEPPPASFSSN
jgi:hypothetical protein